MHVSRWIMTSKQILCYRKLCYLRLNSQTDIIKGMANQKKRINIQKIEDSGEEVKTERRMG